MSDGVKSINTDSTHKQLGSCPYCKTDIAPEAVKCPQCNEYIIRKVSLALGIGIVLVPAIFAWFTLRKGHSSFARVASFAWLLVLLIAIFSTEDNYDEALIIQDPAALEEAGEEVVILDSLMPEQQHIFINVIDTYAQAYAEVENDLQRSKVWTMRDAAIQAIEPPITRVNDWVGVIESIGTNSEGKAYLSIRISNTVQIKTWNNAFSDIMHKTLITQSSDLYGTLSSLQKGAPVRFSAAILDQGNLTESGKINSPEYIAKFITLEPL